MQLHFRTISIANNDLSLSPISHIPYPRDPDPLTHPQSLGEHLEDAPAPTQNATPGHDECVHLLETRADGSVAVRGCRLGEVSERVPLDLLLVLLVILEGAVSVAHRSNDGIHAVQP